VLQNHVAARGLGRCRIAVVARVRPTSVEYTTADTAKAPDLDSRARALPQLPRGRTPYARSLTEVADRRARHGLRPRTATPTSPMHRRLSSSRRRQLGLALPGRIGWTASHASEAADQAPSAVAIRARVRHGPLREPSAELLIGPRAARGPPPLAPRYHSPAHATNPPAADDRTSAAAAPVPEQPSDQPGRDNDAT
jgi:hypothetical protein